MTYTNNNIAIQSSFICVLLVFTFASCHTKQQGKDSAGQYKKNYPTPVKVSLDTAPPPSRVLLKNLPPPFKVQVLKTADGSYSLKTENGIKKDYSKIPSINLAKTPEANFTHFNTYNGLASDIIYDGMMDTKGQLWFSTGNKLCRYDGTEFSTFSTGYGTDLSSIAEDKKGNIWFATWGSGVTCYDGTRFTNFTTDDGLSNNWVTDILLDMNENLWFSTYGGGVSRYDGKTFTSFDFDKGLASNYVSQIAEDAKGNLWFGTYEKGVTCFNGSSFSTFTTEHGLASNTIFSIFPDKKGIIWFGTLEGINRFDPSESKKHFTTLNIELLSKNVNNIGEDKAGNLWFCTVGGGVCCYDPTSNGVRYTILTTEQGLSSNKVFQMTEDKQGNLWFGTDGAGLNRYNGKSISAFTPKQGMLPNRVLSITEDKIGNLWLGNYLGGLSCFDGRSFTQLITGDEGLGNSFCSILPDRTGNLWFASNKGLCCFDGKSITMLNLKQSMVLSAVNHIIQDKKGNLWLGSHEGLICYDGIGFTIFTTQQGLPNNYVSVIVEGPDGDLWIGTEGGGVSRFDGKNFTNYTTAQGLVHNSIKSLIKDKIGNIWIGTSAGVSRFDGSGFVSFNTSNGLADDIVSSMVEDEEGVIWIGTDKGLSGLKFNTSLPGQVSRQIKGAGLLKESNEQLKLYKPVWEIFNTQTGYPLKTLNLLALYVKQQNLPFGNSKDAGTIWGGFTDEKVIRFDPKAVTKNREKPVAFLKAVKVNETALNWYSLSKKEKDSTTVAQQEVMINKTLLPIALRDSIYKKFGKIKFDSISPDHQLPHNLVLPSWGNRVTIDFGAIETGRYFMVRYQYKLEGYDNEWSPVTEKSSATYGNIAEGNYIFKLKARSPEGVWGDPLEYKFRVLPPWYRTWWAYVLYALVFLGALRIFSKWRERNLRSENEKLEIKVKERTNALKATLDNLKATQAQLIQSEKLASLGELTAGIAHEIQNPLNFVNNFAEVSAEMLDEMHVELEKGDTTEAIAIATDLKTNLEKINHHGQRASSIVKGMLEHSRASTGVKEPTDLNALADEFLRLAYHGLRAKDNSFNATMETHFDPDLPLVSVIPQDIGRVLLNLINNAFYAVHQRATTVETLHATSLQYQPTVTISTQRIGDQILIKVKDNGNGIPESISDKIFQPFFTTKPTGQGTGLGLSLAYDIVTKGHGGTLTVDSIEGEGTKFILTLPTLP